MEKQNELYNLGGLSRKVTPEENIVYYRKDFSEMSVNITNRCPNRCVFCIRDRSLGWGVANLYLNEEPSTKEIVSVVSSELEKVASVSKSLPEKIKICGYGEPILRINDLPFVVQEINKEFGPLNWQLSTTGWPLFTILDGESHLRKLYDSGVRTIYMGMHATEEFSYRRILRPINNGQDCFLQAKRFVELANAIGYKVTLAFVNLHKIISYDEISRIKLFSEEMKCNYHLRRLEL